MITYVKKINNNDFLTFSFNSSSQLDSELSTYLTLHPPIAKRALYCLCALHPDEKEDLLQKMIDVCSKKNELI